MTEIRAIHLVEDNANDIELTLAALGTNPWPTRSSETGDVVPPGRQCLLVKPVAFQEFVEAVKLLGGFWAVVNEPPPAQPIEDPAVPEPGARLRILHLEDDASDAMLVKRRCGPTG